jgi:hypothetical protein
MESVQLSTSITLAQDGVRAAIAESFGCRLARFDHWEILLPPKKGEAELNDSDGALLKGELANDVATRYREGELPPFGRHIYNQKEVAYRVEHELGIEMRYIFFRATAVLEGKNGAHVWLAVRAIVQVWAISGWWNRADIKMWTGLNHGRGPILFGSYSFYDRLEDGHEKYIPVPPAFLSFR